MRLDPGGAGTSACASAACVTWRLADTDFWVASAAGSFGGTVDHDRGHYYARDTFARYLGDYPDLETAQRRVEAGLAELRGAMDARTAASASAAAQPPTL